MVKWSAKEEGRENKEEGGTGSRIGEREMTWKGQTV
jgi:hypothetical protein